MRFRCYRDLILRSVCVTCALGFPLTVIGLLCNINVEWLTGSADAYYYNACQVTEIRDCPSAWEFGSTLPTGPGCDEPWTGSIRNFFGPCGGGSDQKGLPGVDYNWDYEYGKSSLGLECSRFNWAPSNNERSTSVLPASSTPNTTFMVTWTIDEIEVDWIGYASFPVFCFQECGHEKPGTNPPRVFGCRHQSQLRFRRLGLAPITSIDPTEKFIMTIDGTYSDYACHTEVYGPPSGPKAVAWELEGTAPCTAENKAAVKQTAWIAVTEGRPSSSEPPTDYDLSFFDAHVIFKMTKETLSAQ